MVFPACLSWRSILQISDQPSQPSSKPSTQSINQPIDLFVYLIDHRHLSLYNYITSICIYLHLSIYLIIYKGFPGGLNSKESTCSAEDWGSIPGWGRSLRSEMANHTSIFVWRIPWTEKPARLQSVGSQRVERDWATNAFLHIYPSFLSWVKPWLTSQFQLFRTNSGPFFLHREDTTLLPILVSQQFAVWLSMEPGPTPMVS